LVVADLLLEWSNALSNWQYRAAAALISAQIGFWSTGSNDRELAQKRTPLAGSIWRPPASSCRMQPAAFGHLN